jgi:hypothetical protein
LGHLAYIHTYIYTHIHTYIHIYTHTHIHTYIHSYIHTHIHIHRKNDCYQLGVTVGPPENLSASVRMGVNDKIVDEGADQRIVGPEPVQVCVCMYVCMYVKSSEMAHFVFKCNKEDYLSVCMYV